MTNNLKKLVISWTEYTLPSYSAWENIEISSWVISANNSYIITESDMTKSTTKTYWVAPYNESYYYTNYTINANAGIKWVEWAWYTFVINTQTTASSYRNVRVRIWTWDYIPVMSSSWTILWWSSYFTKANSRCYQYSTRYESWWALHLMTDRNSTYSAMTTAEIDAGTGTTWRTITPVNLKYAIDNISPVTSVNGSTWAVTWLQTTSNLKTSLTDNSDSYYPSQKAVKTAVDWKQATLVSWTNIKTINSTSLLGSGDIATEKVIMKTQDEYDALPSSKTTDGNTYLIYTAPVTPLWTYAELTANNVTRSQALAELNSRPTEYYNKFSGSWDTWKLYALTGITWLILVRNYWTWRYYAHNYSGHSDVLVRDDIDPSSDVNWQFIKYYNWAFVELNTIPAQGK